VDATELKEIIQDKSIVIVDYFTVWCGPCRMQKSVLEELEKKTDATIVSIDIDKNQQVAIDLGIQAIPTLQFFKNGKVVVFKDGNRDVDRFVGLRPLETLEKILEDLKKEP